jgi:hypothetical protein
VEISLHKFPRQTWCLFTTSFRILLFIEKVRWRQGGEKERVARESVLLSY